MKALEMLDPLYNVGDIHSGMQQCTCCQSRCTTAVSGVLWHRKPALSWNLKVRFYTIIWA
jgi:hypothetical protein